MSLTFRRRKEDFTCEHCGVRVTGDGYTNHCPQCLWSKHVDVYPGDRASSCGGLMEPAEVHPVRDGYLVTHRCVKCGAEKINRIGADELPEGMI